MATADDYAKWLVANADKKGSPQFDTVAQAYEMAKAEEAGAFEPGPAPIDVAPMGAPGPEMSPGQVYDPTSDIPQLDAQGNLIAPEQVPAPDYTLGEMNEGVRETALSLATGATGGTAGMIYGTLTQLAKEIADGKYGTREAAERIAAEAARISQMLTYEPKTPAGQEYTRETAETLGAVAAPLTGLTGELQMIAQSARQAAPMLRQGAPDATGTPAAAAGAEATEAAGLPGVIQQTARTVVRGVEGAAEGFNARRKKIVETIKNDPYNTEVVEYRVENDRPVGDNMASEALRQGWEPAEVTVVKAMTPKDKLAAQKMIKIYETSKTDARAGALERPAQVLGESVTDRISYVNEARKKAGKDLEAVAKNDLKGATVNYTPAIDDFLATLDDMGVKLEMDEDGMVSAIFRDSDIAGDSHAERIITNVLNRLNTTKAPDAYAVHKAKQFIDTQVSYGNQSLANPLSQQAERALKELRAGLNAAIGERFDAYRQANQTYSATKSALDDLQKAAKVKVDLDSPQANEAYGTAMRRVLSNYASRAQIIEALDQLESVAIQNGLKINDDLINQLIFVNSLDRMFGAPGAMTFKGQIEQAIRPGLEAAQRRDVAGLAMDLAAKAYERARGINEANALEAMKELLKRKDKKPPAK